MRPTVALCLWLFAAATTAQTVSLAPAPRPVGSDFTPHHEMVQRIELLAKGSDRLRIQPYGTSYAGRPLFTVLATAPEHLARLDEIRARHADLADPRRVADMALPELADLPVVIWLSYNVHGNEPSPTEAALVLLERLAKATDEHTERWLKHAFIIIDPCLNPDGRERYVQWFRDRVGREPDPEPQSLEHQEPWPGGRPNHYLFDLNRDWAFATQRETRARLPEMLRWHPQVHVDFHEMGYEQDYFFFPAAPPVHALVPASIRRFGEIFGRGNALAFDAQGSPYYTGEDFDLYFPGYGDSWPTMTGAIGMTYEQGGHGRAGLAVRRVSGEVLTLARRIQNHVTASAATIETAVTEREALLREFHAFRRDAIRIGREGPLRAIVLPTGEDQGALAELVATLVLQGIEVDQLTAAASIEDLRDARGGPPVLRTIDAGSYVVRMEQPLMRLARALLEPRTAIDHIDFYDISAWSLPFAFGVRSYESATVPGPLQRLTDPVRPSGKVLAGDATVGWLLDAKPHATLRAATALLSSGIGVRVAEEAFRLGARRYERGTLYVRRSEDGQPTDLAARVAAIAEASGAEFHPAASGFTEEGIDLGSNKVRRIVPPRIALLGGSGTGANSYGATRHLLDQDLKLPHSCLPLSDLPGLDLRRFTAVVVPEANLNERHFAALQTFAAGGGVVIAFGSAAFECLGEGRLSIRPSPGPAAAADEGVLFADDRERKRRLETQPGSIFRLRMDRGHPLAFGYREDAAAFFSGSQAFDPQSGGTPVALFDRDPTLSGYVPEKTAKALEGQAFAMVERVGSGAFVLFADDPNFRGAWKGTARIFLNAALFLPRRFP